MNYTKPSLLSVRAIDFIRHTGANAKTQTGLETDMITPSEPAYEADE